MTFRGDLRAAGGVRGCGAVGRYPIDDIPVGANFGRRRRCQNQSQVEP